MCEKKEDLLHDFTVLTLHVQMKCDAAALHTPNTFETNICISSHFFLWIYKMNNNVIDANNEKKNRSIFPVLKYTMHNLAINHFAINQPL